MADIESTRQSLLACLWAALPRYTPDGFPAVLDPTSGQGLWADATLPYNLRLADGVGPLALVYRKPHLSLTSGVTTDQMQPRRRMLSQRRCNVRRRAKYPRFQGPAGTRTAPTASAAP